MEKASAIQEMTKTKSLENHATSTSSLRNFTLQSYELSLKVISEESTLHAERANIFYWLIKVLRSHFDGRALVSKHHLSVSLILWPTYIFCFTIQFVLKNLPNFSNLSIQFLFKNIVNGISMNFYKFFNFKIAS